MDVKLQFDRGNNREMWEAAINIVNARETAKSKKEEDDRDVAMFIDTLNLREFS